MIFSPSAIHLASYMTDSIGYLPIDVSCDKMNESAPSKTAEVTSSASCLDETSLSIIDSKTWL